MFTRKYLVLGLALAMLAFPFAAQQAGHAYYISFASRVLIFALGAVSLDFIVGYGGLVSLGHAAFVGIGAYVVAISHFHASDMSALFSWPFVFEGTENALLLFPLAMLTAGFAALITGALCLRTRGIHFIMITLAFAQMLYYFFVSLETYGGDDGISLYSRSILPGLDSSNDIVFYYLCFFCLAVFTFFCWKASNSCFGLVIRGAANNERRIKGLGINAFSYQLVAFVIAGAGGGLAGALLANQTEYVSPALLGWTLSGELLVMVIFGGLGTLFGPIIGAVVFLLLEEILSMYTEHWMVFMGPLLVLVVIFAKSGLWGILVREDEKQ